MGNYQPRCRNCSKPNRYSCHCGCDSQGVERATLTAEVERLKGALRSLAEAADCVGGLDEWDSDERLRLETVSAFESLARAALDEGGK
jgi:hypothetical protein